MRQPSRPRLAKMGHRPTPSGTAPLPRQPSGSDERVAPPPVAGRPDEEGRIVEEREQRVGIARVDRRLERAQDLPRVVQDYW
jgi:type IV secretory pathway VirB10-like protein